jgi:hypothetical protein
VKPFLIDNKLASPNHQYAHHKQNNLAITLEATYTNENMVTVPLECEPFLELWGFVVSHYVNQAYEQVTASDDENNRVDVLAPSRYMCPMYSLWVTLFFLANNKDIHTMSPNRTLYTDWLDKFRNITVEQADETYSVDLSEYFEEVFPKLWTIAVTVSGLRPLDLTYKSFSTFFAKDFPGKYLSTMYPYVVNWVYRNQLDTLKAFEYVNLEYYFWKFITVVYDRAEVNQEMLQLPDELFRNLVGVNTIYDLEEGREYGIATHRGAGINVQKIQ